MRKVSFITILFLCLVILTIDMLAFYWLQIITQLITIPYAVNVINSLFWVFGIGLISAIIFLKIRLNSMNPYRKQLLISSLYGLSILSFIPKLIFVVVISILYYTNHVFSEKESLILIPLVGLLSGVLPFLIILFGIFKTLYRFKIHRVKIELDTLPKGIENLKLVHISDLHLGSFSFRYHILERAVKLINGLEPDFIFFTGDLVNNYAWELKGWDSVFKELKATKGKYAVLGNHDYGDYSKWKSPKAKLSNFELIKYFYEKIDFKLLLNEAEIKNIDTTEIAIVGVENWGNPPFKQYGDLKKALTNIEELPFKILLSHDPTHWTEEVVKNSNIVLTLAGHTHGMQAGINYKTKKWSPIKYKYKHWAGLYKIGKQFLHVNRGLGWLGFPGRLGMRPEITLITFKRNDTK